MTVLGKLLVLANLLFSAVMLGWAIQLYLNRIDWSDNPATADQPAGQLVEKIERIKQLHAALQSAEVRFKVPRTLLLAQEQKWTKEHEWSVDQLALLRNNKGGKLDVPVNAPVLKDGRPVEGPDGHPVMQPAKDRTGKDLYTEQYYTERLKLTHEDIAAEQKRLQNAVTEAGELSKQLIGPKGLRQRLEDEKDKKATVEAVLKEMRPQHVGGQVQTELHRAELEALLQRQQQLLARIAELSRYQETSARP
jgi:hypothetical protein